MMKISMKLLTTSVILIAAHSAAIATPQLAGPLNPATTGVSKVKTVGFDTTVTQTAQRARLNWTTIDTNAQESLNFVQPNSNSVIINKVTNGQATNFQGKLNANGKVVLLNEAGLTFADGSQINVNALVASTAKTFKEFDSTSPISGYAENNTTLPTTDGYYYVSDLGDGKITFNGSVNANGGPVFAMAKSIEVGSTGQINANGGKIGLFGGTQYYAVSLKGDGRTYISELANTKSKVNVKGNLISHGGTVQLNSRTQDLASAVLNLDGMVDVFNFGAAPNIVAGTNAGKVKLYSSNTANINGTIDASGSDAQSNPKAGIVKIRTKKDVNVDGTIDASSTTGDNKVKINANRNVDISGDVNASGATDSLVKIKSGKNTTIDGGVQIGAGDAKVTAKKGAVTVTENGYIDAQGNNPNALPSYNPSDNGGNITIVAKKDIKLEGFVDSGSLQGLAGDVNITSQKGSVITDTKIAGDTVTIKAGKDVNIRNTDGDEYITAYNGGYSTGPGTGGIINITSGGNTTVDSLLSAGNINGAGKINLVSKGNTTLNGPIDNSSQFGSGGDVNITAAKNLSSFGAVNTSGNVNGGNINLKSHVFSTDTDAVYTTIGTVKSGTVTINNKPL